MNKSTAREELQKALVERTACIAQKVCPDCGVEISTFMPQGTTIEMTYLAHEEDCPNAKYDELIRFYSLKYGLNLTAEAVPFADDSGGFFSFAYMP